MLKKLTEEQQEKLQMTAIEEFGSKGLEKAAVSEIARRSGISVGVIYKYYKNKDELFDVCLKRSLDMLSEVVGQAVKPEDSLMEAVEKLIRACISFAREHAPYIRMYNAITIRADDEAARYAGEIEKMTSRAYKALIQKAQKDGKVRADLDPACFALFFDDLLMMLHFNYGCRYYEERKAIYLGDDRDDEHIVQQLLLFIKGAFGITE